MGARSLFPLLAVVAVVVAAVSTNAVAGLVAHGPTVPLARGHAHRAQRTDLTGADLAPPVGAVAAPPPDPAPASPPPLAPPQPPPPAGVRSIDGTVGTAGTVEQEAGVGVAAAAATPVGQRLRPALSDADLPDPDVVFDGARTLVFATGSGGRNVSVVTSGDRSNWSAPAEALPNLPAWSRAGLTWAPSVAHVGGHWVLYVAAQDDHVGDHCIARAVADRPEGPYAIVGDQPLVCGVDGGRGAIDPFPFVDTDGRAYLYWKNVGSRARQLFGAPLTPDGVDLAGAPVHLLTATARWEAGGVENPTMIATGGRHWLVYSANWWLDGRYAMGAADCAGPLGPCRKVTIGGSWVSSADGAVGPGAGSLATAGDGTPWIVYAAWDRPSGLRGGGRRLVHLEPLRFDRSGPHLTNRPAIGRLDRTLRVPGGIGVIGWTLDPDAGKPTAAVVSVDGRPATMVVADGPRGDVARGHPGFGPRHGYWATVPLAAGHHEVCVAGADDLGAALATVGCNGVDVSPVPFGKVDQLSATLGRVHLSGWALDPDTAAPISVRIVVDGRPVTSVAASQPRNDVAAAYPGYGASHGWTADVQLSSGDHTVCALGLDSGGGQPGALGCRSVTVSLTAPLS